MCSSPLLGPVELAGRPWNTHVSRTPRWLSAGSTSPWLQSSCASLCEYIGSKTSPWLEGGCRTLLEGGCGTSMGFQVSSKICLELQIGSRTSSSLQVGSTTHSWLQGGSSTSPMLQGGSRRFLTLEGASGTPPWPKLLSSTSVASACLPLQHLKS